MAENAGGSKISDFEMQKMSHLLWLKGGTTDPQFNLVVYAKNLPEKLQFMVPPDGELEFTKSA